MKIINLIIILFYSALSFAQFTPLPTQHPEVPLPAIPVVILCSVSGYVLIKSSKK